jgi:hypothetical protein
MKTSFFTALAIALLVSACGKAPPTQTSTNPELPLTGAEVWKVGGTNFSVEGTAALVMGNGQTLLVVKALCDFQADTSHRPIAQALAKYAVEHGYQKAITESSRGGKLPPFSGAVGVALTQKRSIGSVAASSGYRYSFKAAELQPQDISPSPSK